MLDLAHWIETRLESDSSLTEDEQLVILAALEDPPDGLAELRAVLLGEHEWRQRGAPAQGHEGGGSAIRSSAPGRP